MDALSAIESLYKEHRTHAFEWGVFDCVRFTAKCVDLQLGSHYEAQIQDRFGSYTALQAFRFMHRAGSLEHLVNEFLGLSVPWSRVTTGEPVLGFVPTKPRLKLLGVVVSHQFVTTGPKGLVALPMDFALRGWRL